MTVKRSHRKRITVPENQQEAAVAPVIEGAVSPSPAAFKIGDKVLITREMRIPGQTVRVGYPAVVSGIAAGGKVKVSGDGPCRGKNFWLNVEDLRERV